MSMTALATRRTVLFVAPTGWQVGDKTGSGDCGTASDIAVVWSPARGRQFSRSIPRGRRRTPGARRFGGRRGEAALAAIGADRREFAREKQFDTASDALKMEAWGGLQSRTPGAPGPVIPPLAAPGTVWC